MAGIRSVIARSRRLAGKAYRSVMALAGRRALARMLDRGMPPQLAPALRFLFTGQAPEEARRAAERIEALRAELARRTDTFRFTYSATPVGPARWLERPGAGTQQAGGEGLSSRDLANTISVNPRWGMFLHLCADGFAARTILEMGACVGISGAYLASARSRPRLVTIDASEPLAAIAETTIASITDRATVVNEPFTTGLPAALALLERERQKIDLAYIDGHHDGEATIHYVRTVIPHLAPGALVVLDDIHLYVEMWGAWQSLAAMRGVTAAVNTGRFGLLVWNGGDVTPSHYDLSRFTGWWPVGASRRQIMTR